MNNEKWKCPKCGAENAMDDNFCGECGCKKPEIGIGVSGKVIPKQANPTTENTEKEKQKTDQTEMKQKLLYEILDDETIKRIGRVSSNGEFEPFGGPKNWKCPQCGTENGADNNLCSKCGTKKSESEIKTARVMQKNQIETPKKKFKPLYLVGGLLILMLLAFCGFSFFKSSNHSSADTLSSQVTTGELQWSSKNALNWLDAVDYCKNLNEGGYSDWRLPTISQLRDLVTNCPTLESSGACIMTDDNLYRIGNPLSLSASDEEWKMCHCLHDESGGNKYSKFDGDEGDFWSSTLMPSRGYRAVVLGFHRCGFKGKNLTDLRYFRCVRFPQSSRGKYIKMSDKEAKNLYMQAKALREKNNTEKAIEDILLRIVNSADIESINYEKARELLFFLSDNYLKERKIGNVIWSDRSPESMNWDAAKQYCENLYEGGYDDWRMPEISELRTIIRNCHGASSCRVSDSCLNSGCRSESCKCNKRENNGGYYSEFGDDDTIWLWSSSAVSDTSANTKLVWSVNFGNGGVDYNLESGNIYVRCVRDDRR